MKKRIEGALESITVKGLRLQTGDSVKARLNGRVVEGEIAAIYETNKGVQVRIVRDSFVWNVNVWQVER